MSLDFKRLERVLAEAVARTDPVERAAYLAEACGEDQELRAEVERLLAANEQAGDFLETPVRRVPDSLPGEGAEKTQVVLESDISIERPGAMIGRYKLLEEIGEGGFGVVYMAEQTEPVHRQVALKVVKAGMDTREVIARFEAERQALALMDHPNIAKILDGGVTQAGRPYFVMELVRGIPITEFCDQRSLATPERLRLFVQVCHAVQHAHQKGIIHRDLKPTNILVTLIDGEPVPKVIDFGVAKALGQKLTDKTLFTGFLKMVGTPAYMSPEQADLSGVDIDTRADIYALGVLLYELLTGVTPFDGETLRNAALDEIRRLIREIEPPKPSTRLHTLGERLTEVAKHRHTEPAALSRLVRGDLDWIVMKCLEKDRRRRYETANGLAADIERHLGHEPVVACPPSAGYRVQKLVRRHRVEVLGAAAIVVTLLAATAVSLRLAWVAQRERDRAEASANRARTQAAKATAISDFLQEMLHSANPESVKGTDYTVRQMLDDFSAGLGDQLKDQPEVEAAVRATIGRAYRQLGASDKAQTHLERALELRRRVFGEQSPEAARTLVDLGWSLFELERTKEAEACARQALSIYRSRGAAPSVMVPALWALECILAKQGRNQEAAAAAEEALALARNAADQRFPDLPCMMHQLAQTKSLLGRPAEAEALARQAVALHRQLQGDQHIETAWGLYVLGWVRQNREDYADAEAPLREALQIFHWNYGADHKSVETVLIGSLIPVLVRQGKTTEAESLLRQELTLCRESLGKDHPRFAGLLQSLGEVLRDSGKLPEAEAVFREALTAGRHAWGEGDGRLSGTLYALTGVLAQQGRREEAADLLRRELAQGKELLGPDHPQVATFYGFLAGTVWNQGKLAEAETLYRRALRIQTKTLPAGSPQVAASIGYIGALLRSQGKPAEAESLHREELAKLRALAKDGELPAETTLRMAEQTAGLGLSLRDQGKDAEAAATFRDALALFKKVHAEKDKAAIDSLLGLVTVLIRQGKAAEATPVLAEAAEAGTPAALNGAAWPLATQVDSRARNGEAAVRFAEAAVAKTGRTNAVILDTLAAAYAEARQFTNAVDVQKEAIALLHTTNAKEDYGSRLKLYLKGIPYRDDGALATRVTTLLQEGKCAEAEPLARECLALRENLIPDNWLTFNARSLLGGSLLGQQNYAEAEPLLVVGYEGMKCREHQIPPAGKPRLPEALERLVRLNEALPAASPGSDEYRQDLAAAYRQLLQLQTNSTPPASQDCSRALALIDQAMARARSNGGIEEAAWWNTKGKLLEQLGQYEEALGAVTRAVELASANTNSHALTPAEAHLSRSRLLERMNRLAEAAADRLQALDIPLRDPSAKTNLVDLSLFYNASLKRNWASANPQEDLASLPTGIQALTGTEFDIRALVQVSRFLPLYPPIVTNIPVGQVCERLHFLHAACYADHVPDGTRIGRYVVHYLNGQQRVIPLVIGQDLADWWQQPNEQGKPFVVAWTGSNRLSASLNRRIRLFKTTWPNPRPDLPVQSIDFEALDKQASPFVVAITAE